MHPRPNPAWSSWSTGSPRCGPTSRIPAIELLDDLDRVLTEGPRHGIVMAATADRAGSVPLALATVTSQKWVFQPADRGELASFGLRPADVPGWCPGRFVSVADRLEAQIGWPGEIADAVAALADRWPVPSRRPPDHRHLAGHGRARRPARPHGALAAPRHRRRRSGAGRARRCTRATTSSSPAHRARGARRRSPRSPSRCAGPSRKRGSARSPLAAQRFEGRASSTQWPAPSRISARSPRRAGC